MNCRLTIVVYGIKMALSTKTAMRTHLKCARFLAALFISTSLCGISGVIRAASLGHFTAVVHDQAGHPLSNILVGLLQASSERTFPILTRTDAAGKAVVKDIASGNYEISVKSLGYDNPVNRLVEILPGKTAVVNLVLQQLFQLEGSTEDNLSIKTILRSSADRRLVFRHLPGFEEDSSKHDLFRNFFDEATFEVYTNAGLNGDYLVLPSDPSGGTTTNFAFMESLGRASNYVFAGQMASGEDGLWRVKNLVNYKLNDNHTLQLFFNYGRMSFEQPGVALLNNPMALGNRVDYTRAVGTTKIFTMGFEDSLRWGEMLSVTYGLEVNRVRTGSNYSFISPNAQVSFSATRTTHMRALMASKRSTRGNSVTLPEGGVVNLADAVYFSRVGDQLSLGTSRFYQASITQELNDETEIELAVYKNRLFPGTAPLLAVLEYDPGVEVFQLSEKEAQNNGYRMTFRRNLTPEVKASVSYVVGNAVGVGPERMTLIFDESTMEEFLQWQRYHCVVTQIEAVIPSSRTRLTALVKFIPDGSPLTTLDAFSDHYETSNEGINLFVRQVVPVPGGFLNFLGLDFLSEHQVEVIFDIRNLLNQDLGLIHTSVGDVLLVRNPRTIRGGIALNF